MPEPYVGEVRMFAGSFEPVGWMFCDGRPLPISENEVLFQLIGTTYGGDGESTFNLPNLSSRVPIHAGTGPDGVTYQLGEMAGTESETLTVQQIPTHTHALLATNNNALGTPPNNQQVLAASTEVTVLPYGTDAPTTSLSPQSLAPAGGSQPHENTQPFLVINFIISLFGVFPTQT